MGPQTEEYAQGVRRQIAALATDGSIVCFSDGSKRVVNGCRKVGFGFTVSHRGAEMLALALATKSAVSHARRLNSHTVVVFPDNKAAVSSIGALPKHSGQYASIAFRKAVDDFLAESPTNRVEICWVPGHEGVEGNERADLLASEGCSEAATPILNRSLTWSKAQATHQAARSWSREWTLQAHSRLVTNHIRRPPSLSLSNFSKKFAGHRSIHARLNQVITGHGFFVQ
ncbi:unnamed protein product [Rhizoctonia solani]|uniref:RNase H type-1 domain-containing protein n=1 Tax=Rhizoctonia solani TaxID=456999 RepID=A0A8H3GWB8_9AGAM|nr:unnamed protein product [Rhizoctonia solani]